MDLVANRIERYTEPRPHGYGMLIIGRPGGILDSTTVPGIQIPIDTILGITT